jgi:hypothetical protein
MRGSHLQQSSAALYDQTGTMGGQHTGDAGDATMSRWLQSAGLRHLASPGLDHRFLSNSPVPVCFVFLSFTCILFVSELPFTLR